MNGNYLDNEGIVYNMGGDIITEDGIYIESSHALGSMIYAHPKGTEGIETMVVKKTLSQVLNEDEQIRKIDKYIVICAAMISVALTVSSITLSIMSKQDWFFIIVLSFWTTVYLNGFFRKTALRLGQVVVYWNMTESKKYNYAYSQVINCARKKDDIPTYEEAIKASPYTGGAMTHQFAQSFNCIIRGIADSLVILLIITCLQLLGQGNNSDAKKIFLGMVFIIAGFVMVSLHKGLISDWINKIKHEKWFVMLAEKPFLLKPECKHYDTAIAALSAYCDQEEYIVRHEEEYEVVNSVLDLQEGKVIITLANGDTVIIYL